MPRLRGTEFKIVNLKYIKPPHRVQWESCKDIYESMLADGWIDRPLLGIQKGKKVQCITGSHRIRAARRIFKEVPVFIIKKETIAWLRENFFPSSAIYPPTEYPFYYWTQGLGNYPGNEAPKIAQALHNFMKKDLYTYGGSMCKKPSRKINLRRKR